MDAKNFIDVFDTTLFLNNSVLIDEKNQQNCDFFIFELMKELNYSLMLYNNAKDHFKSILERKNINSRVESYYENPNFKADISDDCWIKKNLLKISEKSKINIFRSDTATEIEYFDYDLIVLISNLKSGCSSEYDGEIKVLKRDLELVEAKYKIMGDNVLYFH